jgi:spore coat protein H
MHPNTRPATAIAALLLSLLLGAVTACGGSSNAPANPPAVTAPPAPMPLHITLDPGDLELLYTRDPMSDDRLDATLRIGDAGEPLPIEIRFRGSSTRFLPKKSFNIRFEDGQELLFGSARLNANAMYTDPAMMREHLAWGMWAALGRPASRTRYLDLWINGVYEGLYIHIERVDEDLLRAAGLNPGGTLVRDRFRDEVGRFIEGHEITTQSAFDFPLSTIKDEATRTRLLSQAFDSRGEPRWDRLAELILWVEQSAPGDTFAAEFRRRFDAGIFVDWLAVHILIGDIDSFADDYWLYLDHDDPQARWIVIPWDKDLSFGSHWRPQGGIANDYFSYEYRVGQGWMNGLVERFLATPELRDLLAARMQELMTVFTRERFAAEIDAAWSVIAASAQRQPGPDAFAIHPQNHFSAQDAPDLHLEVLLDFIELRYAFLDTWPESRPGQKDMAMHDLGARWPGEVLLFTDADGWTIARLELLTAPLYGGTLEIDVRHDPAQQGIDRIWTLRGTATPFDAHLTLYYRNEHPGELSGENWYTGGSVPVGRQGELVMAQRFGVMAEPLAGSRANPYSNKVAARLTIAGHQSLVLTLPP